MNRAVADLLERARASYQDPEQQRRYAAQLDEMDRRAKAWREANPGREAKVLWNFPRDVWIAVTVSEGIRLKLVVPNDAGIELIKALWPLGDPYEPTIGMVRAVLES